MLLYLLAVVMDGPLVAESPAALPATAPPHNYLRPPIEGCDRSGDEIVVCGDKDADERYRFHPIDDQRYADTPIRAETNVLGGTLGTTVSQAGVGGFPSNRIMLNFKIKF
jgi:hypothetical protein